MRNLYAYCFVLILFSCKTKSDLTVINNHPSQHLCPEDGTCTFEVLQNHSLMVNYNKLGALNPTITDGDKLVFKFEYKRNEIPDAVDSSYREELFVELDYNNLEFETDDFKSQKVVFARWCYCKGQAGSYRINKGKLSVKKLKEKTYQLNLIFNTEKLPQVITQINYAFSLNN